MIAIDAQTFASHITVCGRCGREVQGLRAVTGSDTTIAPCGHKASLLLIPNPKLLP